MVRDLDQMKLLRQSSFINLFAAASLVCGYSVAAAAVNDPVAELDAFITRTLKEYQVPGAASRRRARWQSSHSQRDTACGT